jgi:hypothetical protein
MLPQACSAPFSSAEKKKPQTHTYIRALFLSAVQSCRGTINTKEYVPFGKACRCRQNPGIPCPGLLTGRQTRPVYPAWPTAEAASLGAEGRNRTMSSTVMALLYNNLLPIACMGAHTFDSSTFLASRSLSFRSLRPSVLGSCGVNSCSKSTICSGTRF